LRFFLFQAYETKIELNQFFLNILIDLIGFFHDLVFSAVFFYFFGLIGFLIFLLTPTPCHSSGARGTVRWSTVAKPKIFN
jgi:hypothetical protein